MCYCLSQSHSRLNGGDIDKNWSHLCINELELMRIEPIFHVGTVYGAHRNTKHRQFF